MSKIFTAVKPGLAVIDAAITRAILRFWISTLQTQLRHGRQPQQ